MANVSEMRKRWVGLVGSKTTATTLSSITIHHHTSIIHHPSSIGLVESSVKDHLRIQPNIQSYMTIKLLLTTRT